MSDTMECPVCGTVMNRIENGCRDCGLQVDWCQRCGTVQLRGNYLEDVETYESPLFKEVGRLRARRSWLQRVAKRLDLISHDIETLVSTAKVHDNADSMWGPKEEGTDLIDGTEEQTIRTHFLSGSPARSCPACRSAPVPVLITEGGHRGHVMIACEVCGLSTGPCEDIPTAKGVWNGLPRREEA